MQSAATFHRIIASIKKLSDTILVGGECHKIEEIIRKPGSGIIEYRVARR